LPATSINWGAWADAGMGAELKEGSAQRLRRLGLREMSPRLALHGLDVAVSEGAPATMVALIDWEALAARFPPGARVPAFLREFVASPDAPAAETREFLERLSRLSAGERRSSIKDLVISEILQYLPEGTAVDPARGLFDLGLESLSALELKNILQLRLHLQLPATIFFQCANIDELVEYLDRAVLDKSDPPDAPARPSSAVEKAAAMLAMELEDGGEE
jgi:myxalamid-type polyketide synthase MxaB